MITAEVIYEKTKTLDKATLQEVADFVDFVARKRNTRKQYEEMRKHFPAGKIEEADKKLALTLKPDWLYVTQRAFYYIMKGSIAMHRKDMTEAEALFDKALAMDLPSDNEKGMLLLQLANINGSKGKWRAAKNYVREAKKLKITEDPIKAQLLQIEKAVGQSGQIKAARSMGKQGMGMISQGGKSKRRRPKSR